MVDTIRSRSDNITNFADNVSGDISEQDLRDAQISAQGARWTDGAITTTPYTVDRDDEVLLVDATGGNKIVNLLPIASGDKQLIRIFKVDNTANTVTIQPNGVETINGVNGTQVLNSQWQGITLYGANITATDYLIVNSEG